MGAEVARSRRQRSRTLLGLRLVQLLLPLTEVQLLPLTEEASTWLRNAQSAAPSVTKSLLPIPTKTPGDIRELNRVCGKPKVVGKVFGGQDVVAGQWPWQASLLYRGWHFCGAVLIDTQWVVSAAHCFLNKSHAPEDYQVLLGNTQLYQQTQHSRKMPVNRIIIHPEFEKFHAFGSDIVMLQLYLPVNFTSHIIPACLPNPDILLPRNISCWITGWGMLTEDMQLLPPYHLQEGKVGLIENKFCNLLYEHMTTGSKIYSVHEEMLCAGDLSTGRAICRGDSGGPLVCQVISTWILVGLASWGLDCQHPVYPSVFTRVTYFASWIDEIKRVTPPPHPTSAPTQTQLPCQLLATACLPRSCVDLVPPQNFLLLLFILKALWQTLW